MRRTILALALTACGDNAQAPTDGMPGGDTTAPTVAITQLAVNGTACVATPGCDCRAIAGDTIAFSLDATDDVGVAGVGYAITFTTGTSAVSQPTTGTTISEPFTFQIPVGTVETAALTAVATDTSNNSTNATPANICVGAASLAPVVVWEDNSSGRFQAFLRRFDGTAWQELGGSATGTGLSNTPGNAEAPVVALQPNGDPVVAWIDQATGGGIQNAYVKRWTGTAWEELDGSASGGGVSQSPAGNIGAQDVSVAVDSQGRIYVAWKFGQTPGGVCCDLWIFVKRWTGSAWEELAGSATVPGINGTSDGSAPVIRIDSMDRPVVAWNEEAAGGSGCAVWVRRFDGNAWVELDGSASGTGISGTGGNGDPAMDIDRDGNPVVAWGGAFSLGFDVRQLSGTTWVDVGPQTSTGSCEAGGGIPVAVDATDLPTIAVSDVFGDSVVHVEHWDGNTWTELPATGATASASVAGDGTGVILAWTHAADIFVVRWDGAQWQPLGNGAASGGGISNTGKAFGPRVTTR
jgi:hypothetical protein